MSETSDVDTEPSDAGRQLIENLRGVRDRSTLHRVGEGLLLPIRSARLLMQTPRLWLYALAPALINLVIFVMVALGLVWYTPSIVDYFWPQLDTWSAWYGQILWYVVVTLVVVLTFVLSYLVALLVGGIAASPFVDALSEASESMLIEGDQIPRRDESLIRSVVRAVVSSVVVLVSYVLVMVPVLLIHVIPLLGSVAATILGMGVSALFLTLEYTDAPLDRRGHDLREKFELLDQHRALSLGFGLGASLLFGVPVVNVFTIPVVVIGATALAIVLAE